MNTPLKLLSFAVLCLAMRANAQQPAPATDPAKPSKDAQAEAGEPRAHPRGSHPGCHPAIRRR